MRLEGFKVYVGLFSFLLLVIISSCMDDTFTNNDTAKGTFISIRGIGVQSSTHPGTTPDDYIVETLRVLVFDHTTGACIDNVHYNVSQGDIIQHPINPETYDFVFLANEPPYVPVINQLNNITAYNDLNDIAYPERYFSSERIIPMIQEVKNVTVLSGGQGARLDDNSVVSVLQLALDRLAVRVDVVLEAEDDLDNAFDGVMFTNIPDVVPLTANYSGTVTRNITRSFTKVGNAGYFSDETPTAPERAWAKGVNRIILPANELDPVGDKDNAVLLTVNMGSNYNPSCELKITPNPVNYSLPINTKLDFHGIIKEPLEVNIKASEWDKTGNDWEISGNRILNVSDLEVSITDFNGARISFWSNMPIVRVMEYTKKVSTGEEIWTNDVFNALSVRDYSPTFEERFIYESSGSGYMELVLDRPNEIGEETYEITLMAAEDYNGKNALKRKITVHVKQEGTRFDFVKNSVTDQWSRPYVGAFYADNEKGERVISGMRKTFWHRWTATVPDAYKDFIIISATPSFDPKIGTNDPGNPENYPVVANKYKRETGAYVQGRGRIYFRIGLTGTNPNPGTPRYGVVNLTYWDNINGVDVSYDTKIYVRQGGDADYLMRSGTSGATFGQKFSPYNLTAKVFRDNPNTNAEWSAINISDLENSVSLVKYPSQAGAHFQWGLPSASASLARRAYHPTNANVGSKWNITNWPQGYFASQPLWNPSTGTKYKDLYEICPPGYYRPTDGVIDQVSVNSNTYDQVYKSEWRMSLFTSPMKGDANSGTVNSPSVSTLKTELYTPRILTEVMYGFYADGFFDRRPIQSGVMLDGNNRGSGATTRYEGVSLYNAEAAYGGTLIYNPTDNASIFFPAAGRRWHLDGSLEYAGGTGYYWSSSVAPGWTDQSSGKEVGTPLGNIWSMEFNYPTTQPKSSVYHFGYSIRCVKR